MKQTVLFSLTVVGLALMAGAAGRPELVAKVASGELKEARASWWGFDPADSTRFLQAAIRSGVKELAVDKMPTPWIVRPLKGASNLWIALEKGAEVCAKAGGFLEKTDALFLFEQCENVRLSGIGATLRMRREDYTRPPYERSEWRHALWFDCCTNVTVEGLTIASSGGDGIYISSRNQCGRNKGVTIRNVICTDNLRQGISVISAEDLVIENCELRNTRGAAPSAGIDFEPNFPGHALKNCIVRNCRAHDNFGSGCEINAPQLNHTSEPIGISFESCVSEGDGRSFSFNVDSVRGREVGGTLSISNCHFSSPLRTGVSIRENLVTPLKIAISDSSFSETNAYGKRTVTPLDDSWMCEHLPFNSVFGRRVPRVLEPNFAGFAVSDPAPGKMAKVSALRIRSMVTYVVYADMPRKLAFRGQQVRIGRYPVRETSFAVTDVRTGTLVATVPVPGFDSSEFSFEAPERGFYRLSAYLSVGGFVLTESDSPVAIDVTDRPQSFYASVGGFWLVVPAGVRELEVAACGGGRDCRQSVVLQDPRGRKVWHRQSIGRWERIVQPIGDKSGVWSFWMGRPSEGSFADASCDVRGVPGFLFLDKDRLWW